MDGWMDAVRIRGNSLGRGPTASISQSPCQQALLGGLIAELWAAGSYVAEDLTCRPMVGNYTQPEPPVTAIRYQGNLQRPGPPLGAAVGNLRWLGPRLDSGLRVARRGREPRGDLPLRTLFVLEGP